MAQRISTNTFGVSKWVVSADATQGTHTTIASAITSASSGETIFIRDGLYVENITAKSGVILYGESTNSIIQGTVTCSATGSYVFENLVFLTNGANSFSISGATNVQVFIHNSIFLVSNATAISNTNSDNTSVLQIIDCLYFSNAGFALLSSSSAGSTQLFSTYSERGVSVSSTANTISNANVVAIQDCRLTEPLTLSGGIVALRNTVIDTASVNATSLTVSGATVSCSGCSFSSGTASAISSSSGTLTCTETNVTSSNTNAITGAGTILYSDISFTSSATVNTTTQTPLSTLVGRLILGSGVLSTGNAQVMSGTGDPNAAVTAPKGSLYLRVDGSSTTTRAYINTDSATAWTSVTTAT